MSTENNWKSGLDNVEAGVLGHFVLDQFRVGAEQFVPVTRHVRQPQMILNKPRASLGNLGGNLGVLPGKLDEPVELLLPGGAGDGDVVDPGLHGGVEILQPLVTYVEHQRPETNELVRD